MANLPVSHPAEILQISPEGLEVANCYLQCQNTDTVAQTLGLSPEIVSDLLNRREIKAYINQVFFDTGFNNRFKLRAAMDAIIAKKFEEMDDAGIGSNKDILEILALSHKMTMESLAKELELEKLRLGSQPKTQNNIQINDSGSNYGNLIERLIKTNTIDG